jgi:MYXO-CTERM domain-containing protein
VRCFVSVALLAACTSPLGDARQGLTGAARTERYTVIRDNAAGMGQYNAALIAGIALSETGLAHCHDEAPSFSCPGPASSSCNGSAVIAGGADGPCSAMQGGLGMFQLDAGTYADTVNTYGPRILTVEGNSAQAVWFVTDKVETDIAGASDWLAAMAWMNQIKLDAADPVMNQWAGLLACRYNGCCSASAACTTRANGYRDNAIAAYGEMGAAFWDESQRCAQLPADGVIDERSNCYVAGGDPRFWRHETVGVGGTLDWTQTTNAAAPANFAEWIVKTGRSGKFHVDVALDGGTFGTSKQAAYQIAHAGVVDTVVVDQTSASGYVSLGDFAFAGSGDEHVLLGDDTGEQGTKLLFDAIRVQSLDAPGDAGGCGGCATGGGAGAGSALVALVTIFRRRKTRRKSCLR